MIKKLLIANRGEVALRIGRTCRELGIRTVAIYCDSDRDAMHVKAADTSVRIGPDNLQDSYLNGRAILNAALTTGCDAIHPGYGFLSENADFAEEVRNHGLIFIGPNTEILVKIQSKLDAKQLMKNAGVPVLPGCDNPIETLSDALKIASQIGYPVIFKHVYGAGGRGIRIAHSEEECAEAFYASKMECQFEHAKSQVYLESYLHPVKHVEVQLIGDAYGNVIHLHERDCTFQRRHQKVIEEAPCASITEDLRQTLFRYAISAFQSIGYDNVGTVEFLIDENKRPYFMEINPRIQVEHTITEQITGIDLVRQQIRCAQGDVLELTQADIQIKGVAIECRINAEDLAQEFRPEPGRIDFVHLPNGNHVRTESMLVEGMVLSPMFDPMIAKVITSNKTRTLAIRDMLKALDETLIHGVATNIPFLAIATRSHAFTCGEYDSRLAPKCAAQAVLEAQEKTIKPKISVSVRIKTSEGHCLKCNGSLRLNEIPIHQNVCPACGHHHRLDAWTRIRLLTDPHTFQELYDDVRISFAELDADYQVKFLTAQKNTGLCEAIVCGEAKIDEIPVAIGVMDAAFMMGSMGQVVGEKITRLIEHAQTSHLPLILVSASGGARMQEGILGLIQMAKISSALAKFNESKGLFISVLTDPTTGGVSASFALAGDIHLAEPNALIGFTGKRVIEQTMHTSLPDDFQTAEFLHARGFIDQIVPRQQLKSKLSTILRLHTSHTNDALITLEGDSEVRTPIEKSAWQHVLAARDFKRPKASDILPYWIENWIPLAGDRCFGEDPALIGGIGSLMGMPITVLAFNKGHTLEENQKNNYGMMKPEGYRKAIRLANQAAKFNRPVLTIIDTPGAYPGKEAEERGQAAAIAECMMTFATLAVPTIAIVLSEGVSGGALALSVTDKIFMFENAVYSIITPEGYASILWKDTSKTAQAAKNLKLTSNDLLNQGIIDGILFEHEMETDFPKFLDRVKHKIFHAFTQLQAMSETSRREARDRKYRNIGKNLL